MIKRHVIKGNHYALTTFKVHAVRVEGNGRATNVVLFVNHATEEGYVFSGARKSRGCVNSLHVIKQLEIVEIIEIHIISDLNADVEARNKQVFVALPDIANTRAETPGPPVLEEPKIRLDGEAVGGRRAKAPQQEIKLAPAVPDERVAGGAASKPGRVLRLRGSNRP